MTQRTYLVYGFSSTHKVLAAEDLLMQHNISLKIIPRPVSLGGAECGIAVRIIPEDASAVESLFDKHGIDPVASTTITDISA